MTELICRDPVRSVVSQQYWVHELTAQQAFDLQSIEDQLERFARQLTYTHRHTPKGSCLDAEHFKQMPQWVFMDLLDESTAFNRRPGDVPSESVGNGDGVSKISGISSASK